MNNTSAITIIKSAGFSKQKIKGITINTDASFSQKHLVGGYAFTIVCDLFKIQKSGMFKGTVQTSQDAEMQCIANALATLNAQTELPKIKWLYINTDCLDAIRKITQQKNDLGKFTHKILKEILSRTGCKVYKFRHVKAHTLNDDARSWANHWCDKESRSWRMVAESNKMRATV